MKFLCDRCKTRYSIGDDRVRGKILKIRCKNCANVITVREGMSADPDAAPTPEHTARAKKSTTAAPEAMISERNDAAGPAGEPAARRARDTAAKDPAKPATLAKQPAAQRPAQPTAAKRSAAQDAARSEPASPISAALASAAAKPPAALEEEWYVSIDGVQAGPYSLPDAQRWVGQKPVEAELHCWREGFEDWLPIDKVSQFRGLRKRPVPPLPRIAPQRPGGISGAPALPAQPVAPAAEEPKPLFAATEGIRSIAGKGPRDSLARGNPSGATMAALERSASTAPSPATPARATPPFGNPIPRSGATTKAPNGVRPARASEAPIAEPRRDAGPPLATARGTPFDVSDDGDPDGDLEPTRYRDPTMDPRPPSQPLAAVAAPAPAEALRGAVVSAPASDFESDAHIGDDLDIGEVSRVVNLADIIRSPRPMRSGALPSLGRATGQNPNLGRMTGQNPNLGRLTGQNPNLGRMTGQNPSFRSTGAMASFPAGTAASATPGAEQAEPGALPPAVRSHRRAVIALIGVALLVLGGAGAVLYFTLNDDDDTTTSDLGPVRSIDTSRPEDPVTHRPIERPTVTPNPPPRIVHQTPRPIPAIGSATTGGGNREPEAPAGDALRSDEIEDVARKHQEMTQRCYMRSQRGADAILVGDVKKIAVTLTIDKDGGVSNLELSDHSADNLGKCLTGAIKSWKFRPSAGGSFRFSLNFVNG